MRAVVASDAGSARQVDRGTWAAERLTVLYRVHAADAFRYALHITGRREDAEDVVQHVFLQAYATLEAGRDLVSPRAWLIKATKHRALNLIRDRRDAPVAQIDPSARSTSANGETEALAEVRAVLWTLPEPQHHAFVLRHWSGLSQDEIADVLATTPHAVESLLVRARAALVDAREASDPECAGVRRRLARMLAPTAAQRSHVAECRRCRTAQTRLLRASEHAAAFALVPGPGSHVLHALSAAVPGFGASTAAVSAASAATKAGVATKIALAATTAAVAVTAVHPLRSAITRDILHHAPAPSVAAPPQRPAPKVVAAHAPATATARTRSVPSAGSAVTRAGGPRSHHAGKGRRGAAHGRSASAHDKSAAAHARSGAAHGKSAAAHARAGAEHGKSASAPGHTKAPGSHAATGRGAGKGHHGHGHSHPHGQPGGGHRGRGGSPL
jgi:RNA polymerase sigma-70 factor (ECF subfamily)